MSPVDETKLWLLTQDGHNPYWTNAYRQFSALRERAELTPSQATWLATFTKQLPLAIAEYDRTGFPPKELPWTADENGAGSTSSPRRGSPLLGS